LGGGIFLSAANVDSDGGLHSKVTNDKKWLSLQRDRRNSYGEGPIASCLFYEWGCQTDRDLLFGTLQSSILKIVIATAVYL